jgi:hypothetical protein
MARKDGPMVEKRDGNFVFKDDARNRVAGCDSAKEAGWVIHDAALTSGQ